MSQPQGKLVVVAPGPGGVEQTTLQALRCIEHGDVFLCSDPARRQFSEYIKDKPVLLNPWKGLWDFRGMPWDRLAESDAATIDAFKKERLALRDDIVGRVRAHMVDGKTVVLIETGDPAIFGPSFWFLESFKEEELEIIPGVGVFSAAMAALKRTALPALDANVVIQTSPLMFLPDTEAQVLKDFTKHPATLVFYMALWGFDRLIGRLLESLAADTPVAVVYHVGDTEKQMIVRGVLSDIQGKVRQIGENFSGLVIVGRVLTHDTPYRTKIEDLVRI